VHVVGVVQARLGSTRLPKKVLRPICGRAMILRIWDRLRLCNELGGGVIVAIPTTPDNDRLAAVLEREGLCSIRGPEEALATRLLMAADYLGADAIVRITGDEALIDPCVVDRAVAAWRKDPRYQYVSNVYPAMTRSWPEGIDIELITRALLERLCAADAGPLAQASPSQWIWRHATTILNSVLVDGPLPSPLAALHWSVDTAEDLAGANVVFSRLPEGFTTEEVLAEFGPMNLPEIAQVHVSG